MKGEIHVWMPMIGFDREEADKGAGKLLARMPFVPHGVSAFLFHPDIVNQHPGMGVERTLPPDNCSYYGSPRNEDRCRQAWTNYDLRALVGNLAAAGVEPYLGIMGVDLGNRWHTEWIGEHPEVRFASRDFEWSLYVLKRLADGSYYEDFFVDKLCEVLTDYGFAGLQVADNFCPAGSTLHHGDFSADMFGQFVEHAGIDVPAELRAGLSDDSRAMRCRRGDWIWRTCREPWIGFNAWRWEQFWRKVCGRLHRIAVPAADAAIQASRTSATASTRRWNSSQVAAAAWASTSSPPRRRRSESTIGWEISSQICGTGDSAPSRSTVSDASGFG